MRLTLPSKSAPKPVQKILFGLPAVFLVGLLVFLPILGGRSLPRAVVEQPVRLQDFLWGAAFAIASIAGWVLWNRLSSELR
jgi:hypothetical protein